MPKKELRKLRRGLARIVFADDKITEYKCACGRIANKKEMALLNEKKSTTFFTCPLKWCKRNMTVSRDEAYRIIQCIQIEN